MAEAENKISTAVKAIKDVGDELQQTKEQLGREQAESFHYSAISRARRLLFFPDTNVKLPRSDEPPPPPPSEQASPTREAEPERPRSRQQSLVLKFTNEEFPGGWKDIETRDLLKRVGDRLQKAQQPIPKRDVFLRAYGRRRG
jgi:hypothetical protein